MGNKNINGLDMNFMQAVEAFKIVNNFNDKKKSWKVWEMENKFPGKDITENDLKDKFPLSSSKNKKSLKFLKI